MLLFVTSSPPHLKTKTQKHEKHIFDLCDLSESDSCEKGRRSPIEFKADPLDPCPDVTTSLGGLQYPALIATEWPTSDQARAAAHAKKDSIDSANMYGGIVWFEV